MSRIDLDNRGLSIESATVKYRDHESAQKALENLHSIKNKYKNILKIKALY